MKSRLAALGAGGVEARTFHSAALAQLHRYAPGAVGRILPTKALLLRQIANSLPPPYKFRPAGDLATEIEHAKARRIAAGRLPRLARRPRAADPGEPDAHGLPRVRAAEGRARRDRLRGRARARGPALRDRRAGARRPARPLPRVHGRRVPGREPAPADAARPVARPARRPLRRRRRLPVDLRLHRRVAASGCSASAERFPQRDGRAARGELPLDAAGARAREPARAAARRRREGAARRRGRPGRSRCCARSRRRRRRTSGSPASCGCSRTRACRSRRRRSSAARTRGWPTSRRCCTRPACRSRARRCSRATRRGGCCALLDRDGSTDVARRVRALAVEAGWLEQLPDKLGDRELTRQADLARLVKLAEELDDGAR